MSEQLKEGYKRTEVGFIPEEWIISQIQDIGNVDPENLNSKTSPQYEFKYVSLEDVNRGELKGYSEIKFQEAPSRARRVLRKNDVVFGTVRPNLKSHFYVDEEVKDLICSTGFAVIRPYDGFNGRLIFEHLFSGNIDRQLNAILVGSNYPAVNSKEVKSLKIPLPPTLEEQKAIATALSDVDTLITNLDKLIAKKKAIKQGAMQRLLKSPAQGGQRLPGFKGEWVNKTLEMVSSSLVRGPFGGALKKEFFVHSGYKVYEQRNAIYGTVDLGNYFINEDKFKELHRFEVKTGDFIVSCSGTIGRIYQIPDNYQRGVINQALLKITINSSEIDEKYFFYQFTWDQFQNKVIDDTQGGAMKNLVGMDKFKKAELPCPPSLAEQKAIATILSDMDKAIESIETKKSKYLRIKQGMMQELLTGKTRLV
jgi:type I restriction enzyme S subunit